MKLDRELWTDRGEARPTLHVQLSLPAVALDEDGGAQEGRAPERPHKGAEHERELQGPELGQEGGGQSRRRRSEICRETGKERSREGLPWRSSS